MTALGMAETAKLEGHRAILHTAAASNLGQMMQKICSADGIPLINIVRSKEQVDLLRGIGAVHVLNSVDGDFRDRLIAAIAETDSSEERREGKAWVITCRSRWSPSHTKKTHTKTVTLQYAQRK